MGDIAAAVVDVGLNQHRIARGFVNLDSVAVGKDTLELSAVEAGSAADQSQAGRIKEELVLLQALQYLSPVDAGNQEIGETAGAIFRRHHFVGTEHAEIFRYQRIGSNRPTDRKSDLDRVGD